MTLNRVLAGGANARWPCECGCAERVPRYPTDLTDEQWAVLEPVLPVMLCDTELGGRPERHWRRTMIDAMFYVVDNGAKWRALPADFPPWQTVYGMHARWKQDGVLADITDLLRAAVRTAEGRPAEPSAAIIDSQSVHESAEGVVPTATSGFDHYKKVNGRKRHLLADTGGLLITVIVTPASTADRDVARSCCARPAAAAAASPWPGPTTATTATGWPGRTTSPASPPRSSSAPAWAGEQASRSCPAAGSSNAPTPGSAAAGAAPATTRGFPPTTPRWSTGPPYSR